MSTVNKASTGLRHPKADPPKARGVRYWVSNKDPFTPITEDEMNARRGQLFDTTKPGMWGQS